MNSMHMDNKVPPWSVRFVNSVGPPKVVEASPGSQASLVDT